VGHEQEGRRPGVVVSINEVHEVLSIATIVPTSKIIRNRNSPLIPILPQGQPTPLESAVLAPQIRTVDSGRFLPNSYIGDVTPDQMRAIELAIAYLLRLRPLMGPPGLRPT
jgi:mRNA-degrading endonuclease toxin of MazEF toxin-antitoxin module